MANCNALRWEEGTIEKLEEAKHAAEQFLLDLKQERLKCAADAQRLAEDSAKREAEAKEREEEALQREKEAIEREEDTLRREEVAKHAAEQARLQLEQVKQKCEELEKREKEAKKKEEEAKRLADEFKQAMLCAQRRELEANAKVLETQKRESESQKREEKIRKDLQQAKVYLLEKGLSSWPTEEEFLLAKKRIQYDPEKLHFAVCGSPGSGKSSLINAFRGLKNNSRQAAPTGVIETTMDFIRYPASDPRKEYNRLVWFDCQCPGGTLEIPGWQYFNQKGFFIFDLIVLVYDSRFTQIDVSIIQSCERFEIPLFIVRSKADRNIRNVMYDIGYDEDDDEADDVFDDFQRRARQLLIDSTKKNLEDNLEKAELNKHDVFIVTSSVIFSLVNGKAIKKTIPAIDETRLMESILRIAQARRYGTQASTTNYLIFVKNYIFRYIF